MCTASFLCISENFANFFGGSERHKMRFHPYSN